MDHGDTREITTPNYPADYYNNAVIVWAVSAPSGYGLRAHFTNFSLEEDYDFLTVNEGLTPRFEESVELARLTGTQVPEYAISNGPYVWLRFTSDGIVTNPGFRLIMDVVDISGTSMALRFQSHMQHRKPITLCRKNLIKNRRMKSRLYLELM